MGATPRQTALLITERNTCATEMVEAAHRKRKLWGGEEVFFGIWVIYSIAKENVG